MQARLPADWTPHESVLRPVSPPAHAVNGLWHFMIVISMIVYVLVIAAAIYAAMRSRREHPGTEMDRERTMRRAVSVCTGLTVLILFVYLLYDFGVGRAVAAPLRAPSIVHVSLVGHQWWWEATYEDTAVHRRFTTANEIHVPVHRPVLLKLTSTDVIHSFWMPNLNGKKDLIPGHINDAWFQADTPGVYRGQCAEFCGLEHAKMALVIVAQPERDYDRWYEQQLQPAAVPSDSASAAGEKVFLSGPCVLCHAIGGTAAGATYGPDLTHFGSRLMLAAGTVDNTRGNLGGWITDPQHLKPGAYMPANNLAPKDLRNLISYLEGLK